MLQKGQKAPPFELESHEGDTLRLSDFAGQNVLLWFYPKADTPG